MAERTPRTKTHRASLKRDGDNSLRRQEILAVAARCFARRGYEATTVRDIATDCGILSGSLYHHFVSKDEILHEILQPQVDCLLARYREISARDAPALEVLEELVKFNLKHLLNANNEQRVLYFERHLLRNSPNFLFARKFYIEVNSLFVETLKRCIDEGSLTDLVDIELIEIFILRFIASLIDPPEGLRKKSRKSIEEGVMAFIMRAIGA